MPMVALLFLGALLLINAPRTSSSERTALLYIAAPFPDGSVLVSLPGFALHLHPLNLNEAIRVLQLKAPVVL